MMKIVVLNGSPKGDLSVTLQYVKFLQKKFPGHEFKIFHISRDIQRLKTETGAFQAVVDEIRASDLVVWAFPIYICLVPAQYKHFIELVYDNGVEEDFRGKHTIILTTSKHYYDHTAINYLHAVCDDLNMKFQGVYSADMYELLSSVRQRKLMDFIALVFEAVEMDQMTTRVYDPLPKSQFSYTPSTPTGKINPGKYKILVIQDERGQDSNLDKMTARFVSSFDTGVELVYLEDQEIKGGCRGCIRCSYDNRCVYGENDGLYRFVEDKVKKADILIFVGKIKDRFLSARWKYFFDRMFYHNHVPALPGKQIAYIITGPLRQISNLRQIIEGRTELQRANLVDIVTDEPENSEEVDRLLEILAGKVIRHVELGYRRTESFLGVGGSKILRDMVWGEVRWVFQADHRYYKKEGYYDFPQKKWRLRIRNMFMAGLMKFPRIRKKIYEMTLKQMTENFRNIVS